MKTDYIAVILAVALTSMTAATASYISDVKDNTQYIAQHNARLEVIEQTLINSLEIHKDLHKSINKITDNNTKMQIAVTRIATVIEIKLGDSDAKRKEREGN